MKYIVVKGWQVEVFETEVMYYLDHGWTLQGGVSVTTSTNNEITYAQALIKQGE